jgi:hypothetical protein
MRVFFLLKYRVTNCIHDFIFRKKFFWNIELLIVSMILFSEKIYLHDEWRRSQYLAWEELLYYAELLTGNQKAKGPNLASSVDFICTTTYPLHMINTQYF